MLKLSQIPIPVFNPRGLLVRLAAKRNTWNDFTATHKIAASIIIFVLIPVFAIKAVIADYEVMYSIYFNASNSVMWSNIKALPFAVAIALMVYISTSGITYILVKRLHCKQCLNHDGVRVDNPFYKFNRVMLFVYFVLGCIAYLCTGFLSFESSEVAKTKSKPLIEQTNVIAGEKESDISEFSQKQILAIEKRYKSDSTRIAKTYYSKMLAAAPTEYERLKQLKIEKADWKYKLKNGTASQKKEAPKSIRHIDTKKIPKTRKDIARKTAKLRNERADSLSSLQNRTMAMIAEITDFQMDKSRTVFNESNEGKGTIIESATIAAFTYRGANILINLINGLLSVFATFFLTGAAKGQTPVEYDDSHIYDDYSDIESNKQKRSKNKVESNKKKRQIQTKKTGSLSGKPGAASNTQSNNSIQSNQSVKSNNHQSAGSPGATSVPANLKRKLSTVKLALSRAQSNRSNYKRKCNVKNPTQNNLDMFEKWSKKVLELTEERNSLKSQIKSV